MQPRPRLNPDVLFSRSAHAASQGAFSVLNCLQDIPHPADQLIGLACALRAVSAACGYDPVQMIALAERMEADCRFREVNTLAAVAKYAEDEIRKKL